MGRYHYEDTILYTKSFEKWDDANDYQERLSESVKKRLHVIGCYSNFDGTFLVIQDSQYDCLDRIFIESEYEANYAATHLQIMFSRLLAHPFGTYTHR